MSSRVDSLAQSDFDSPILLEDFQNRIYKIAPAIPIVDVYPGFDLLEY
jgi:hypothetical protein